MSSHTSHKVQVSDWDCEKPLYKHSETSQNLRDSGMYGAHLQQSMQRTTMENPDRSLLGLPLNLSLPDISSLSISPQVPRRYAADVGNELENLRQPRASFDVFGSQALLSPAKQESSPSPAICPADLSPTPTRHLIISVPTSVDLAALKQLLKVQITILKGLGHC